MSFNIYDATVAVFIRELNNLKGVLKKGEAWCDEQGKPHSYLLKRSLAPDMLLLPFQVWTCCNYAKHTVTRVGTTEPFVVEDNQETFAELYGRIDDTIALLRQSKREDYNDVNKPVQLRGPHPDLDFNAKSYTQRVLLPTFFFHETATYFIMRNAGVPLGKADFMDFPTLLDP